MCNQNTHRLVKELVIFDSNLERAEHPFSETIATILKKDLIGHLQERSAFIILAFIENESLNSYISSDDIKVKEVKKLVKSNPKLKGASLILKKLK